MTHALARFLIRLHRPVSPPETDASAVSAADRAAERAAAALVLLTLVLTILA